MAEKKEKTKATGGQKKNEAGGEKNEDGIATILLKLDLHCDGCAKKVRRSVRHFECVEDVKADYGTGKLTVKGNVDPLWLREMVERKTKKKVTLLYSPPKMDGGGGNKKPDEKVEKKAEDEKPKKAQFNKIRLQSAQKVKRFLKELTPHLKDKLKRNVDVVPPKKDNGSGGVDSRKEKEDGDGKKKDGEWTVANKSIKTEMINKMEYYGYNTQSTYYSTPPMYNQNYMDQDYGVPMQISGYGHNSGYNVQTSPLPAYITAPQMFSDENPNACSVM